MPPPYQHHPETSVKKTIEQVIEEQGLYPHEAFDFVRRGLAYTAEVIHAAQTDPEAGRHVSGQQLCEGLRRYALMQWGLMARTVLSRWNILRTEDFGKIVFTMVENGDMGKTEGDTIEDFRRVYDFKTAFEVGYRIEARASESRP
jgi:uncharacterized repeat protein (TIGR04138 family)